MRKGLFGQQTDGARGMRKDGEEEDGDENDDEVEDDDEEDNEDEWMTMSG